MQIGASGLLQLQVHRHALKKMAPILVFHITHCGNSKFATCRIDRKVAVGIIYQKGDIFVFMWLDMIQLN